MLCLVWHRSAILRCNVCCVLYGAILKCVEYCVAEISHFEVECMLCVVWQRSAILRWWYKKCRRVGWARPSPWQPAAPSSHPPRARCSTTSSASSPMATVSARCVSCLCMVTLASCSAMLRIRPQSS